LGDNTKFNSNKLLLESKSLEIKTNQADLA